MKYTVITKEFIVSKFMEELNSVEIIPMSEEFTDSISHYISEHAKHLSKVPVSEMQKTWLEKDQKMFDSTINILNLWGKLRKLKEMKIEL